MQKIVNNEEEMKKIGQLIGSLLIGGEVIELVGDVGSGKTTFVKGLAVGLGISDYIQSPSFSISRVYDNNKGMNLIHYDFYRLDDPGLMANELNESIDNKNNIVVIEWADVVEGVLPADRLKINIEYLSENERKMTFETGGQSGQKILSGINLW